MYGARRFVFQPIRCFSFDSFFFVQLKPLVEIRIIQEQFEAIKSLKKIEMRLDKFTVSYIKACNMGLNDILAATNTIFLLEY